jgi:hypothetical protein
MEKTTTEAAETVFVVVVVHYDHYRFQENVGATADVEMARSIASKEAVKNMTRGSREPLSVIEDEVESAAQDQQKNDHIWIQAIPMNLDSARSEGTSKPCSQYLPLMEIPPEVHAAAETLFIFFETKGMREWQFSHVAARRLVVNLERQVEELRDHIALLTGC